MNASGSNFVFPPPPPPPAKATKSPSARQYCSQLPKNHWNSHSRGLGGEQGSRGNLARSGAKRTTHQNGKGNAFNEGINFVSKTGPVNGYSLPEYPPHLHLHQLNTQHSPRTQFNDAKSYQALQSSSPLAPALQPSYLGTLSIQSSVGYQYQLPAPIPSDSGGSRAVLGLNHLAGCSGHIPSVFSPESQLKQQFQPPQGQIQPPNEPWPTSFQALDSLHNKDHQLPQLSVGQQGSGGYTLPHAHQYGFSKNSYFNVSNEIQFRPSSVTESRNSSCERTSLLSKQNRPPRHSVCLNLSSKISNSNKRLKHNLLGLTPKTVDGNESEELYDFDEEQRMAEALGTRLHFTYKGKTSTLQTPTEIEAWIAERKKRYPTKQRIAEKGLLFKQPLKNVKEPPQRLHAKESTRKYNSPREEAEAALRDINKAKQKLQERELKFAKLQAKILKNEQANTNNGKRKRVIPDPKRTAGSENGIISKANIGSASTTAQHAEVLDPGSDIFGDTLITEPSLLSSVFEEALQPSALMPSAVVIEDDDGTMYLSSASSITESSSATDSSCIESYCVDSSPSAGSPEEVSSRRSGPEKVPPPSRQGPIPACRQFKRGSCFRGSNSKFKHDNDRQDVKGNKMPRSLGAHKENSPTVRKTLAERVSSL
ncbi:MAG: hypothetical protein M1829_002412 [Trizodia sp. TS-e1964]|nr:MAG: hypothetical protein M1829_002412 [Trizodia sp. TS-e1964]